MTSTSKTTYGRSPWTAAFPTSRIPSYPRYRGALKTDLVIVGGGLTGCITAHLCAAAGVKVTLLEAERIGHGSSGSSSGWIADDPGVPFMDLEKALGRRAARHAWHSWRRAALDFASFLRKLDVKCHLESRPALLMASTSEQLAHLKR